MDLERTQYIGHYGVTFSVIRFTVRPNNKQALASLCLLEAKTSAQEVRLRLQNLYERMLAQDLPCLMTVVISKPLTRKQADSLNNRNKVIKETISGAVAAPIGLMSSKAESLVEKATSDLISRQLRNFQHADIIIGLEAQVSGGIGPQRSSLSLHVYSNEP
ncbi:hypothetical protein H097_00665 [Pseudomonas sp. FH4]|jgi:hypothetical protein|uniref:Uncharacterized protein n=1 Tax=Pseudomonas brenneri TaxID=129817 RepID=A0A5B2UQF1_9PSED|nr:MULTISPECIES: hypothetical protein [Pseudomonas]KAA6166047.1 hypothetical protein F3K50_27100 [Pseudomonas marginalis]ETK21545.1 hypothetical protein H097_00665 [Pseudomonas sp. FH4]KAA2228911.1 hypothetical protein F1720_17005 [Pseudomonas brenneri]MBF8004849.1 hypothetical protein [Pseudomonas brenneri]TWR76481.1 hypothetical protein FJD34_20250 [Pseudomonas brenneri]